MKRGNGFVDILHNSVPLIRELSSAQIIDRLCDFMLREVAEMCKYFQVHRHFDFD